MSSTLTAVYCCVVLIVHLDLAQSSQLHRDNDDEVMGDIRVHNNCSYDVYSVRRTRTSVCTTYSVHCTLYTIHTIRIP